MTKYKVTGAVGVAGDNARVGQVNLVTPRREVVWPVSVGSPPPRASAFQARAGVSERFAAPAGTVVLCGDGGRGKSQLAADLYARSGAELRMWLTAESRTSVITGYAAAAIRLDLADADAGPEHLAELLLRFLERTDHVWLVVLDDVADPADLDQLWPSGSGRTVVTTRRRDAALSGGGRTPIEVGVFTSDEAVVYLTERVTEHTAGLAQDDLPSDVLDAAEALAEDLGYLPLALSHAAAVVIDQAVTCQRFREWFADRRQRLDELFPRTADTDGYNRTIGATWELAVDAADELAPAHLARPLASLIAITDPAGAPEGLYTSDTACAHLAAQAKAEVSADMARRALRNLARLSLIQHTSDSGTSRAVRMHNLTGRAIRETHTSDETAQLVQTVADALLEIWPEIENNPVQSETLRANTTAINDTAPNALWNAGTGAHDLLFRAGRSLRDAGLVHAEIVHYVRLLAESRTRLGPGHPSSLAAAHNLARAYQSAGSLDRAIPIFERNLTDTTRTLGPHHPDTLSARKGLASAYESAGNLDRAIPLFEQTLTDRTRVLGRDHPDTLLARSSLAWAYQSAGRLDRAIPLLEQTLTDRMRVLGPDHPDTLAARNNLANAYQAAGHFDRAIPLLEQNLTETARILGPDHPSALIAGNNMAYAYETAGRLDRAIPIFEQSLTDHARVLGPDHPISLTAQHNLAAAYWSAGNLDRAIPLLEESLANHTRILGPDHPDTLTAENSVACVYRAAGHLNRAIRLLKQNVANRIRVLGPDHPDTLTAENDLAGAYQSAGNLSRAIPLFEQNLIDRTRVLGPDHPDTFIAQNNLATAYAWAGDLDRAILLYEQTVADCTRVLGPDHPDTQRWQRNLALASEAAEDRKHISRDSPAHEPE